MARFGQSFIQSLTQPGYSQGMFDLGSTLGQAPALAKEKRERESMMAQIKDMTPLETADYMIGKAETPEQLIAAKSARTSALKNTGINTINDLKQQLVGETDPDVMQEIEKAMVIVGRETGNDITQYAGIAGKTLAARDKAAWDQAQQQAEQRAVVDKRMVDFAVNGMMATGSTELPTTLKTPQGEVPIPENLRDDIQAEYVKRAKAEGDFQAAIDGGKLPADYTTFISKNPQLFKDNAALQTQVRIIQETEGKGPSATRTNAIKAVRTLVDAEQAKRREASTSDEAKEITVNGLIEEIITSEDRTYWWEGDDMQDFLTGDGSEEEIKLFRSQAVQYLKETPNASKQEVIDAGMTGMKRKIPGQRKSEDREAQEAQQRQTMATIKEQIRKANPDRDFTEGQLDALVQRELSVMEMTERGRRAQTSRSFQ